jgi:acetyl-CoA C-acetyltransferase
MGGQIPINMSGGLKARGHPVGATGVAQAVEVVKQLRGEAGERQITGAKRGLTQNMGGTGGSSVVHVFEAE